jgi:hypothetical protein
MPFFKGKFLYILELTGSTFCTPLFVIKLHHGLVKIVIRCHQIRLGTFIPNEFLSSLGNKTYELPECLKIL